MKVYFDTSSPCPLCNESTVETPATFVSEDTLSYSTSEMKCVICGSECSYTGSNDTDGAITVIWSEQ